MSVPAGGTAPLSLTEFDQFLHTLYGAVGHDEAWTEVVRALAAALRADVACWCTTDGEGPQAPSFYAAWNLPEELNRAYAERWLPDNPWLQAGLVRNAFMQGSILRGTDLVPAPVLRQTRFYREYMLRYPVEHMLTAVMSDGSVPGLAPPMLLNLFRHPQQPDFDAADVARLHLLYPHLLRAFDLHWLQRRRQEQVGLLHQFLDALDFGMVMLDPAAQALYANYAARALAATPSLAPWLGQLPVRVTAHDALARLVHAAARGRGGGLVLGDEQRRLMALALPIDEHRRLTADGAPNPAPPPGACMLLLAQQGHAPTGVPDFVTRLFGLSAAEARVLPLLLRGQPPADIATELGVKLSTVRTQLSAIFAKTGAMRQQDLIRLLGSVPPVRL
ncbi:helix-turn-helix transcriptional regulator [Ottowia sp. GY511]|uniref:Helix-turn-helix transcriptional regulator n=1 Tax=Ottowia flava TaxID=2675430 RepID=A0ABW4KT21_9BURK|nr:helix-turn-helix transcriptional regulator [Ottowia sp. GY511]TXK33131.1 helix-turn-helix transcriptional regulator [Ottowia sp. GY511]